MILQQLCVRILHICIHSAPLNSTLPQCSDCIQKPEAQASGPYEAIGSNNSGLQSASHLNIAAASGEQLRHSKPGPSSSSESAEVEAGRLHWSLVRWVWAYFSSGGARPASRTEKTGDANMGTRHPNHGSTAGQGTESIAKGGRITRTRLSPLYFQHEGHSRTIVGIERRADPRAAEARDRAQAARFFRGQSSQGGTLRSLED